MPIVTCRHGLPPELCRRCGRPMPVPHDDELEEAA